MKTNIAEKELYSLDKIFDEIFILESLLKTTKKSHLFDDFIESDKIKNDERNDYINLLDIALQKVENIKELNCKLEKIICYNPIISNQSDINYSTK